MGEARPRAERVPRIFVSQIPSKAAPIEIGKRRRYTGRANTRNTECMHC